MNKLTKMTHEEHLEFAEKFRRVCAELVEIEDVVAKRFGKCSRAARKLNTAVKSITISIRSELDEEYHQVTSSKQFDKSGHAYYNAPEDRNAPIQLNLF